MVQIDFDEHVWEGWTVGDFIVELDPMIENVMSGNSWEEPFGDYGALKRYCIDNQPYYKEFIPAVVDYFADKYSIY